LRGQFEILHKFKKNIKTKQYNKKETQILNELKDIFKVDINSKDTKEIFEFFSFSKDTQISKADK